MIFPLTQIFQSHYTKIVNKFGFGFPKETSIQILYSTEKMSEIKWKTRKKMRKDIETNAIKIYPLVTLGFR